LEVAGVPDVHLHLGHVGVYRALIQWAGLPSGLETDLFDALQHQSRPDVEMILSALPEKQEAFLRLLESRGGFEVIESCRQAYTQIPGAEAALSNLERLIERLQRTLDPTTDVSVDLSDLRGYRYHTGTVFNAYTPGHGRAVAQGGRYDEIGKAFGRARSATGFSADLRQLLRYDRSPTPADAIAAPGEDDAELDAVIRKLRADGARVIRVLPGQPESDLRGQCDRRLARSAEGWRVEPIES